MPCDLALMTLHTSRIEHLKIMYRRWAAELECRGNDDPVYAQHLAEALDDLTVLIKHLEAGQSTPALGNDSPATQQRIRTMKNPRV